MYLLPTNLELPRPPSFKFSYRLAEERQFDMAVKVIGVFVPAVAHKLFAHILDHAGLNQA
jgi:hypothetical protein